MGLLDDLRFLVTLKAPPKPPPAHRPDPPSRESYEAALAAVEAMRKERDRWIDEAAMKAREILSLRMERDRAWLDVEAAHRRLAYLESRVDGLTIENAELRDEADRLAGRSSPVGPPVEGSWSGLVEGG